MRSLIWGVLIVIDKLANVIFLGSPHKTISMRLSFAIFCSAVRPKYNWVIPLGHFIDWIFEVTGIEKNHIYNSYEAEEMVNPAMWRLYEVTNIDQYDEIKNKVMQVRFMGRI